MYDLSISQYLLWYLQYTPIRKSETTKYTHTQKNYGSLTPRELNSRTSPQSVGASKHSLRRLPTPHQEGTQHLQVALWFQGCISLHIALLALGPPGFISIKSAVKLALIGSFCKKMKYNVTLKKWSYNSTLKNVYCFMYNDQSYLCMRVTYKRPSRGFVAVLLCVEFGGWSKIIRILDMSRGKKNFRRNKHIFTLDQLLLKMAWFYRMSSDKVFYK